MTTDGSTTAERRPRLGSLPGSSALVRISDGAWGWLRAVMLEQEPSAQITEEQIIELERAGLLVQSPQGDGSLSVQRHWEQVLRTGLRSPVGVELVCVDGAEGWTTALRIAGRFVLVVDQVREVLAGEETLRLGRRSGAVTLGLTTIEALGDTFETVIPQRPAFTGRTPAATAPAPSGPAAEELADAPALAQVQMLVVSAPDEEGTAAGGGSWYALGEGGEQLAVLVPAEDGADEDSPVLRGLAPGALTSAMRQKVIAAIDHVSAGAGERAAS